MADLSLFIELSGWIIGVVGLALAVFEYQKRRAAENTLNQLRESSFTQTLRTAVYAAIPSLDVFSLPEIIKRLSSQHSAEYLEKVVIGDQTVLLEFWDKVGLDLGAQLGEKASRYAKNIPQGLGECSTFLFISQFSPLRARAHFRQIHDKHLQEDVARFYFALTNPSSDLDEILSRYKSCNEEEVVGLLAKLRGEELSSIVNLIQSDKWSKKVASRMKEVLQTRKVSYNSLTNKVIETNPIPRLYLLFKNEGAEPEQDEESAKMRPVQQLMHNLREKNEATLVTSTAPVYFLKDGDALSKVINNLPQTEDSNYIVFSAAVDPLSVNVKTSDRLDGHPAGIYENLLRFRDYREVYESIALRLGLSPNEIIETADLGFLIEPKSEDLAAQLSKATKQILGELSEFSGRRLKLLTDLRDLDDDDIGYLGNLMSKFCSLSQAEGRKYAERIAEQAKELYELMYAPLVSNPGA